MNKKQIFKILWRGHFERQAAVYYSCRKGKVIEMKLKDSSSEILRAEKSGRSFKGIGVKLCVGAAVILAAGAISLSVFTGEIEAADSLVTNETEQTQENSADINVYEAQAPVLTTQIQTEKLTEAKVKSTTASETAESTEKTTEAVTTEATTQAAITHAVKTTSKVTTTTTAASTAAKTTQAFKTYEMYTNDELNLRSGAGTGYSKITVVPYASLVTVTGNAADGWYPVKYNGKSGYVYGKYLQSTKPKVTTTVITTKATTQSSSKSTSTSTSSKYLGTFKVTAYCSCEKCCGSGATGYTASGTKAKAGRTIAASSKYAFGTQLMFNGTVYTVEDRGGSVNGNVIDLYFDSHEEACSWGVRYCDVYLVG